ncbi:hypothetical protein BGZ96_002540 [Linnemannia gamsii]|uniref:Mif2/CENP-C cupin domain-containing protein n=1 Tax=Linnemannia gamsii TaxID=64522 RepID=A0ABQ7JKQ5_9FUNG|nr:hypothetical protein BGZ96_002540 [Linnemannia gamsii]
MNKDFDAGPRVRTNNFFDIGVVGRRTGIAMKANVKKDADGLDNIDDFWDDEDNESASDNDQYGTHGAEQDDFSGDDGGEVHPSPSVQNSDPRRYLEQEAPEELLLTPTSRRSRGGSKGSHLYAGAEGSPSPSLDRIRKRLVFTKDSSDNETEQTPSVRGQTNKSISVSPALDKILNDSQERKAKMAMNAGRDSALLVKGSSAGSISSSAAANKGPAKAVPSKAMAKRTTAQPSKAPAPSRRPVDVPKAFDLGGDFDGQDDFELPEYNISSSLNDAGDSSDAGRQQIPPPATSAKTKSVRKPSEFKRKSKVVPKRPALSDDDSPVHDEQGTRSQDDDRMRFSDEDGPSRNEDDQESEEEEEETLQDNRRRLAATSQKKRGASTKEPASVSNEGKRAARVTIAATKKANIPKTAASSKNARQKQRWGDENEDEADLSSEDSRVVPSATRSKGKSKQASNKRAGGLNESKAFNRTQEIPIVPEQNLEDSGVRRSHRTKVAPLEFWKNEKLVFDKTNDGLIIKSVMRAAPEKKVPSSNSESNKRKRQPRSETKAPPARRQRTVRRKDAQEDRQEYGHDHESEENNSDSMGEHQVLKSKGLSEDPKVTADILVFGSDDIVLKDIAESNESLQFRKVQSGEYQLHRGLEDADSVVTGTMKIKPEGKKPVNSGTNTSMVFYVIKGLVQVKVHESQFVVSTGGRFLVPRGNTYSIVNISNKESTLFFVQTKQPRPDTTEIIATSSSAAASTSSSTKASTKRTSQIGGYTTVQPDVDLSDRIQSPPRVEEATTGATESRSPSPVPATNKRRSTSARRSLTKKTEAAVTPPSPSLPPSTTADETTKSNGGATAGVSRQPSVLASMFR